MTLLQRAHRFLRDRAGGAAIEFALLGPVLALIFVAVTDFGLGFYRRMQVQSAAQHGALYATVRGYDATQISNAITGSRGSVSATPAPAQFCGCPTTSGVSVVTCGTACTFGGATATAGTYVTASAQGAYTPVLQYPGVPTTLTFSASQSVRIR